MRRIHGWTSVLAAGLLVPALAHANPDLIITGLDTSGVVTDPQSLTVSGVVSATVENLGPGHSNAYLVVFFEDRNANDSFDAGADSVLGTAPMPWLMAGMQMVAGAAVSGQVLFPGNVIHAFVDRDDTVIEVNEANNVTPSGSACVFGGGGAAPNLTASLLRCTAGDATSYATARVGNAGAASAPPGVSVSFYDGDPTAGGTLLGSTATIASLAPGGFEDVSVPLAGGFDFGIDLYVVVDADGSVDECEEGDNTHHLAGCDPGPPLQVEKSATPATATAPGSTVTFEYKVTNLGPSAATIDVVEDDQLGILNSSCEAPLPHTLPPGETLECALVEFISGSSTSPHINTVTVLGTDEGGNQLQASDTAVVQFVDACEPDPKGQGHWHRQCLGLSSAEGGIDPGRGRGPSAPTEASFAGEWKPAVDARLTTLLDLEGGTCAGMDADPPSDPCEQAIKQLTALLLNVEAGRLQESCSLSPAVVGCSSTNLGALIDELAALIGAGGAAACNQAHACASAVNSAHGISANAAPFAARDRFTTDEDVTLTGSLLQDNGEGLDYDPDGDALSLMPAPLAGPFHGVATLQPDGSFTYVPAQDFNGTDVFQYVLLDGRGGEDEGSVLVHVVPVNDAPRAQDDVFSADEDSRLVVSTPGVLANDVDPERDALTVVSFDGTSALGATVFMTDDGRVTYDGRDVPELQALAAGETGVDRFTYVSADPAGGTGTGNVWITVAGRNDAPVAVNDAYSTSAAAPLDDPALVLIENDHDVDGTVTALESSGRSALGGTFQVLADGTFVYDPTSSPELQSLASVDSREDSFPYVIRDGGFAVAVGVVSITVTGVADPPGAAPDQYATSGNTALEVGSGRSGRPTVFTGSVLDSDRDGGREALTVSLDEESVHPRASVDMNPDGSFRYVPAPGARGSDSFRYHVSDGVHVSTGTVTIELVERVWYVRPGGPPGGSGRSAEPFRTLRQAAEASRAGDTPPSPSPAAGK